MLKEVAEPLDLTADTELPHEFDLYWDAKTGSDILESSLRNDPNVNLMLAEHGFKRCDFPH